VYTFAKLQDQDQLLVLILDQPYNGFMPKCVVTLGPASLALPVELVEAGAGFFRFNTSHMDLGALREAAQSIRTLLPEIPLVMDLQGAKMRLGEFPQTRIDRGARLIFSLHPGTGFPLPHPELYLQARVGDTLRADDARLSFRVVSVGSETIEATALEEGILKPRKGINVVEHPVLLGDLSAFDISVCELALRAGRTSLALSFVRDGSEVDWVRRRSPGCPVVCKVERAEAVANWELLASLADELWICRGDLGAQTGVVPMARWISRLDPLAVERPVLMAGQVLEHLTGHSEPTRAEVCHLCDLMRRGYAGIVLSDETAIGSDPVRATRIAASLMQAFG
jgi:pyruvate kinase